MQGNYRGGENISSHIIRNTAQAGSSGIRKTIDDPVFLLVSLDQATLLQDVQVVGQFRIGDPDTMLDNAYTKWLYTEQVKDLQAYRVRECMVNPAHQLQAIRCREPAAQTFKPADPFEIGADFFRNIFSYTTGNAYLLGRMAGWHVSI
jgi:hypothetical protein